MSDLATLVANVKQEADRLKGEGLDIDSAYHDAIIEVFKRMGESQALSPFEEKLINAIKRLSVNGNPVRSSSLAVECGGMDTWSVWYHCSRLRNRGLVRMQGKRGWLLAA